MIEGRGPGTLIRLPKPTAIMATTFLRECRLSLHLRVSAVAVASVILCGGQPAAETAKGTADDHRHMMEQLGIRALRPGPSGNESAPNHANYDESAANPFPDYPDVLKLKDGRNVTTADMWWKLRRPEIV